MVNFLVTLKAFKSGFLAMIPVMFLEGTGFMVNQLLGVLLQGGGGCLLRLGRAFHLPLMVLEMGFNFAPTLGGGPFLRFSWSENHDPCSFLEPGVFLFCSKLQHPQGAWRSDVPAHSDDHLA
jgi:hypothetical protein